MNTFIYKLLILLTLFACSCIPTKHIQQTLNYNYDNLVFIPEHKSNITADLVEINIIPIDAKELDKETDKAAFLDGNYEKEFIHGTIQTYLNEKESASNSKYDRNILNSTKKAFKYLDKKSSVGEIPIDVAYWLKKSVLNPDEELYYDGTEIPRLMDEDDYYRSNNNPYVLNGKYLSVLKIEFKNNNSEVKSIKLDDFQIISNQEQLYPFKTDFLENTYKNNIDKVKNAHRFNMPENLVLAPDQKIFKYLAFPPIDPTCKKLTINLLSGKKSTEFSFDVNRIPRKKTYIMDRYNFTTNLASTLGDSYYCLKTKTRSFPILENYFFVSPEASYEEVSLYSIILSGSGAAYFGKKENFRFKNYSDKFNVKLEFHSIK